MCVCVCVCVSGDEGRGLPKDSAREVRRRREREFRRERRGIESRGQRKCERERDFYKRET